MALVKTFQCEKLISKIHVRNLLNNIVILIVLVLVISPFIVSRNAFADFNATNGTYFCNSNDLNAEKNGYSYFIYQENRNWDGESPQDIATTILKTGYSSTMLDNLGKAYHCLKDNNIDPDSVQIIPSYILQGLNLAKEQNPEKFAQIAPSFSDYVPVPEFGTLAGVIIIISMIGVMVISRRIN